jgi:sulfoxide reductase heme-binding subunit YedZ
MTKKGMALLKVFIWAGCLTPLLWLVVRAFGIAQTSLGANAVETVLHTLGKTGINILFLTLAVTPARVLTGINALVRTRRLLGLFSFFYIALHFVTYVTLDLQFDWSTLYTDIAERPYITVGMAALLGMIPLAVTSTSKMQRRLGRRWLTLHRTIYPVAVLALVHFLWQVKIDQREPLIYAAILAVLLGFRLFRSVRLRVRRVRYQ